MKRLVVVDAIPCGVIATEDAQQPFTVAAFRLAARPSSFRFKCRVVHLAYFFDVVFLLAFFAAVCFLGLPDSFFGLCASTGNSQYGPRGVSCLTAPSTFPLLSQYITVV